MTKGPVPKRSDVRIRRNKDYPEITSAAAGGAHPAPYLPDEAWHPVARELFDAAQRSGQAQFYEMTDWWSVYFACEAISMHLRPQFIGFAEESDGGKSRKYPVMAVQPPNGATLNAIRSMMAALLMTEADRRRSQLELQKAATEVAASAGSAAVTDIRSRLMGPRRG